MKIGDVELMTTRELAVAAAGAFVALQAHQKMIEGRGAADDADVKRYCEEADTLFAMIMEAPP